MTLIYKETIKRNFSENAFRYDSYSAVQERCALDLISGIKERYFKNILEIGCGTGFYTSLLRERFPEARITAVDISEEMVREAEQKLPDSNIDFITADGEDIRPKERFSLITSNSTFQWFENLGKALSRYSELLDEKGKMYFTLLGPGTFVELYDSLKALFGGTAASIDARHFIKKDELERILRRIFDDMAIQKHVYKECYNSLEHLLKSIKYTGTKGRGLGRAGLWTAKKTKDLERIYREKFKAIAASYEVYFCEAA